MSETAEIAALIEDFDFLDDWEDRFNYLIELGDGLDPLPPEDHNNATKVLGCVAQVWLRADHSEVDDIWHFAGDSDGRIQCGLIAILMVMYSGRKSVEILETDARAIFEEMGLNDHLTPQRSNGLFSMVSYIRQYAAGERIPGQVMA